MLREARYGIPSHCLMISITIPYWWRGKHPAPHGLPRLYAFTLDIEEGKAALSTAA